MVSADRSNIVQRHAEVKKKWPGKLTAKKRHINAFYLPKTQYSKVVLKTVKELDIRVSILQLPKISTSYAWYDHNYAMLIFVAWNPGLRV